MPAGAGAGIAGAGIEVGIAGAGIGVGIGTGAGIGGTGPAAGTSALLAGRAAGNSEAAGTERTGVAAAGSIA